MDIRNFLQETLKECKRWVVLGAGSELKADDAVGMLVANELKKALASYENILVVPGSTAPENFTGLIKSFAPDHIILVDAAYIKEDVGTIGVIDPDCIKGISFSTHMLPFNVMVNYLEQEVGCSISIIGIQPASTELAEPMCAEVEAAGLELVEAIKQYAETCC